MAGVRVVLTVFKDDGKYYASRQFPTSTPVAPFMPPAVEIFSIDREITPETMRGMEEEAKSKAREMGIAHVINLD